CFFFFFSSRRRHTRSKRDWSSDVCSSDLSNFEIVATGRYLLIVLGMQKPPRDGPDGPKDFVRELQSKMQAPGGLTVGGPGLWCEIGRASCRERAEIWEVERA